MIEYFLKLFRITSPKVEEFNHGSKSEAALCQLNQASIIILVSQKLKRPLSSEEIKAIKRIRSPKMLEALEQIWEWTEISQEELERQLEYWVTKIEQNSI